MADDSNVDYDGVRHPQELIRHLSSEIGKATDVQLAQRTRNNFSVAFGPYIILGSYILAAGRVPNFSAISQSVLLVSAVVFVVAYTAAGWLSATIEARLWDQANDWRKVIADTTEVHRDRLTFDKAGLHASYMAIYAVLGIVFCIVLFMLSRMPSPA